MLALNADYYRSLSQMKLYAPAVLSFLVLIVLLARQKHMPSEMRLIAFLLALSSISLLFTELLPPYHFLPHVLILIHATGTWYVYQKLTTQYNRKWINRIYAATLVIIFTILIASKGSKSLESLQFALQFLMVISFCLLLFDEFLRTPSSKNLLKDKLFWFNTGLFFYSCISFVSLSGKGYFGRYEYVSIWMSNLTTGLTWAFNGFLLLLISLPTFTENTNGN